MKDFPFCLHNVFMKFDWRHLLSEVKGYKTVWAALLKAEMDSQIVLNNVPSPSVRLNMSLPLILRPPCFQ